MRATRTMLAWVVVMVMLAAGCQTVTGRSGGQWAEDKATTARVKTALGATEISTLTRVDVDTVEGIVYLRGKVESEDVKRRAEEIARTVTGTRRVENGLIVDRGLAGEQPRDTTPPASPPTTR
jgi:hyperosmotically inducible protein